MTDDDIEFAIIMANRHLQQMIAANELVLKELRERKEGGKQNVLLPNKAPWCPVCEEHVWCKHQLEWYDEEEKAWNEIQAVNSEANVEWDKEDNDWEYDPDDPLFDGPIITI